MVASSSSPVHQASLVDPSLHSPALLELLDIKVSRPVIDYTIDCVVEAVDFALGRASSSSRGRSLSRHSETSAFSTFVNNVLTRAEITFPVVLASLVYIDRAKPHLHIALEEWACERVFLGAVMVASKYLNDSTLKNVHWALCTGVFGKRDVGRIEREFLDVLDFELGISEDDLLSHHHGLSAIALRSHSHRVRSHHSHMPSKVSHHHSSSVPELEPSSPHASSTPGSASPRTPDTLVSTVIEPSSESKPQLQEIEVTVHPTKKSHFHFSDLLRSFPIPISLPLHQHPRAAPHVRFSSFPSASSETSSSSTSSSTSSRHPVLPPPVTQLCA